MHTHQSLQTKRRLDPPRGIVRVDVEVIQMVVDDEGARASSGADGVAVDAVAADDVGELVHARQ